MERLKNIIYGINPVIEALNSGITLKAIYISSRRQDPVTKEIITLAHRQKTPVYFKPKEYFETQLPKGNQGICAEITHKKNYLVEELIELSLRASSPAFLLILDCIEDPHNFGALLRVADSAGINGVIFQSHRSVGLTSTVAKVSAGAISHVRLAEVVNIKHAIMKLKQHDITIIGAEAGSGVLLWDMDFKGHFALVVGSEGKGMRKTVKEMCDYLISLPQLGKVSSLNVSVATGIIAYEALRQRR